MANITVTSTNIENISMGRLTARFNAAGTRVLRYYIDLRHTRLNLHRELSAPEIFLLQSKVDALVASWDVKFAQDQVRLLLQSGKDAADQMTVDAIAKLEGLNRILAHTLTVDDAVDWDALKDRSAYLKPRSFPETKPAKSQVDVSAYTAPRVSLIDRVLGRKTRLIAEAEAAHSAHVVDCERRQGEADAVHAKAVAAWKRRETGFWSDHKTAEAALIDEQAVRNAKVDDLRSALAGGEPEAVVEHASMVLEASEYEGLFEKSYEVQYRREDRLLMVAYDLPSPQALPNTKAVKFIKATGEMKPTRISEREEKANFDAVAYQVCLRTLHELLEADVDCNVGKILFNGHVNFIDPRTGLPGRSCLLSVLVDREAFQAIDLARVDPKSCFKGLKGVSAASLHSLTPIPPVMEMNREDRRFVDAREVGSTMDASTNLASIPWEDFEHLVRELFEKEFAVRGGEVKVTQASRDGGVDAIAFDPDPISGGKIVIQAKRYTRTVGVSAVRDLYGTVMNEGASKGILVTTADYGPDAYQFANGKPLTLLSGSNLLHLLERHGYAARIDVAEARAAMQ